MGNYVHYIQKFKTMKGGQKRVPQMGPHKKTFIHYLTKLTYLSIGHQFI